MPRVVGQVIDPEFSAQADELWRSAAATPFGFERGRQWSGWVAASGQFLLSIDTGPSGPGSSPGADITLQSQRLPVRGTPRARRAASSARELPIQVHTGWPVGLRARLALLQEQGVGPEPPLQIHRQQG